jgi:hypothetical protein
VRVQDADAKERQARAALESRRLLDQHIFSVQREASKAESHIIKQQEGIRERMVHI